MRISPHIRDINTLFNKNNRIDQSLHYKIHSFFNLPSFQSVLLLLMQYMVYFMHQSELVPIFNVDYESEGEKLKGYTVFKLLAQYTIHILENMPNFNYRFDAFEMDWIDRLIRFTQGQDLKKFYGSQK